MKQNETAWKATNIPPRSRVILDNDYSGDPDGIVQLAHHLLSPSVEIPFVIGSHLRQGDFFDPSEATADHAAETVRKIAALADRRDVRVIAGSNIALKDESTPADSRAAEAIINEAMREDTKLPLFVVCGGGLTEIASAWLMEPKIAEKLTVIWIGGHEHEGFAEIPPGGTTMEYNLNIDSIAGRVVFNNSNLTLWQVPRNMYRTILASRAELMTRMLPAGKLGKYLFEALGKIADRAGSHGFSLGETYILGDSPLVLLTALTSAFEPDASSSDYSVIPCPKITKAGLYEKNPAGRPLRVYTRLDQRLLLEDLYAKLMLHRLAEIKQEV